MVVWVDNGPQRKAAEEGVRAILRYLGEDVDREGLADTPRRVGSALREMTLGQTENPEQHLKRVFDSTCEVSEGLSVGYDGMVTENEISFTSTCEHHLLPFWGLAWVGYVACPGSKVVGISKLARVVEVYARRLQMQERITAQVAHCINENLEVDGVMVVLKAAHSCIRCRGARNHTTTLTTSVCLGVLREDGKARDEMMRLMGL